MIFSVFSALLLAGAPSQPVDVRGVLVELTIDVKGIVRARNTIESAGTKLIDGMACLLVSSKGVEVPSDAMPLPGSPAPIKRKVRAAMVQFADGASQLVTPPERMMRKAFMDTYAEGHKGVILVEARDNKRGRLSCAIFAPRTISRFDPARCAQVLSADPLSDPTVGEKRPALLWRNAVVAAGDL